MLNLQQYLHIEKLLNDFFTVIGNAAAENSRTYSFLISAIFNDDEYARLMTSKISSLVKKSIITLRSCLYNPSNLFADLRELGTVLDEAGALKQIKTMLDKEILIGMDKVRAEERIANQMKKSEEQIRQLVEQNEKLKQAVDDYTKFTVKQQFKMNKQQNDILNLKNTIQSLNSCNYQQVINLSEQVNKVKELEAELSQSKAEILAVKSAKKQSPLVASSIFCNNISPVTVATVSAVDEKRYAERCGPLLSLEQINKFLDFHKIIDQIVQNAKQNVEKNKLAVNCDDGLREFCRILSQYYAYFGNFIGSMLNASKFNFKDGTSKVISQEQDLKIVIKKIIDEQRAMVKDLVKKIKGFNIQNIKDMVCLDEMHQAMNDFVKSLDVNELEDSSANDSSRSPLTAQIGGL